MDKKENNNDDVNICVKARSKALFVCFKALFSFFIVAPFIFRLDVVTIEPGHTRFWHLLQIFKDSLKVKPLEGTLIWVFSLCIIHKENGRVRLDRIITAGLFSVIVVFGASYQKYGSWIAIINSSIGQVLKASIIIIGYFMIFYCALGIVESWLYSPIDTNVDKNHPHNIQKALLLYFSPFLRHSFLVNFACITICWLPYFFIMYPGITAYDTGTAIQLYYQSGEINNGVSAYYVWIIVFFLNIGFCFGNYAIGIALYSLIQMIIMSALLAISLNYLKWIGVSLKIRVIILLTYIFIPTFPFHAIQMGSDVPYSIAIMVYSFWLYYMARHNSCARKTTVLLHCFPGTIAMMMLSLIRHTGIYIVLANLFFLSVYCFFKKGKNITYMIICHIVIVTTFLCLNKLVLPNIVTNNKVNPSSSMLNITKQQVSFYYSKYGLDGLDEEEQNFMEENIDLELVPEKYNKELSDGVSKLFHINGTGFDKKEYLKICLKLCFRHPDAFLEASNNMWYGYFYPNYRSKTKYYMFTKLERLNEGAVVVQYSNSTEKLRDNLDEYWRLLYDSPIGVMFSIGFYVWIILYMIIKMICKKNPLKEFIPLIPIILTLFICMMSPVNGYTRYALPIILTTPFLFGLWSINETKDKYR